jgi:hypothetical protein
MRGISLTSSLPENDSLVVLVAFTNGEEELGFDAFNVISPSLPEEDTNFIDPPSPIPHPPSPIPLPSSASFFTCPSAALRRRDEDGGGVFFLILVSKNPSDQPPVRSAICNRTELFIFSILDLQFLQPRAQFPVGRVARRATLCADVDEGGGGRSPTSASSL